MIFERSNDRTAKELEGRKKEEQRKAVVQRKMH